LPGRCSPMAAASRQRTSRRRRKELAGDEARASRAARLHGAQPASYLAPRP
jgi:hypothetical protein